MKGLNNAAAALALSTGLGCGAAPAHKPLPSGAFADVPAVVKRGNADQFAWGVVQACDASLLPQTVRCAGECHVYDLIAGSRECVQAYIKDASADTADDDLEPGDLLANFDGSSIYIEEPGFYAHDRLVGAGCSVSGNLELPNGTILDILAVIKREIDACDH